MRVPRQLGYKNVKYLTRITLTDNLKRFGKGRGVRRRKAGTRGTPEFERKPVKNQRTVPSVSRETSLYSSHVANLPHSLARARIPYRLALLIAQQNCIGTFHQFSGKDHVRSFLLDF